MQLNHLNLCVNDLTQASTLFQTCFDFQFVEQKGKALVIMTNQDDFTLVLMNTEAFGKQLQPYPDGFHLGFLQKTTADVDNLYQRIAATGIELTQKPAKMRGETYGFYFTALNDILFEVSSPL